MNNPPTFEPGGESENVEDRGQMHSRLRFVSLVVSPATLTGIASIFTLVGTGLILRQLPAIEAGNFALLVALSELAAMIAVHGFPTVITRTYSDPKQPDFDWQGDMFSTIVFAVPVLLIIISLVSLLYVLPTVGLIYIFTNGALRVGLSTFAYMINAKKHYSLSALLMRLPNSLLILPALLFWAYPASAALSTALTSHVLGIFVILTFAVLRFRHFLPDGSMRVSVVTRLSGVVFLFSAVSMRLPDYGFVVIGGAFLNPASLAAFAAALIFLRPFKLIRNIFSMILMPEFIRGASSPHKRQYMQLIALAAFGAALTALAGPPLFRWFYQDRYQLALTIIPILGLAGALHLISVLPRSYIGGRASFKFINRMVLWEGSAILLALVAGSIGVIVADLAGLALAVILVEGSRLVISHRYWRRLITLESGPG